MDERRAHRRITALLLASILWLATCRGRDEAATFELPDVVLIVVDTLRADHLGSYGFDYDTSPNLDELAARSVLWERAVAASSLTAPSHASMMTSRFVRGHSIGTVNGGSRLSGLDTMAMQFRRAGYDTAAFVSNYVLAPRIGLDRGFDVYDAELPEAESNRTTVFERVADQTTDAALEWLEDRADRPYFLWVHYQDPHGPYTPPAPHDRSFPKLAKSDGRRLPELSDNTGRGGVPRYQVLPDVASIGGYRRAYAGEIEYFDSSLGRLVTAIDARGRPSVVLFTADHGESMGENDRYFAHGHATTLDLVHVPFLIRAPGFAPARRREVVHHVDIMPTLLELAGLEPGSGAAGIALGPIVRQRRDVPDRFLFSDSVRDASVFHRDRIMRVEPDDDTREPGSRGRATAYGWGDPPDSRPSLREQEGMKRALRAYLATREPVEPVRSAPDPDAEARLRALGYLEPVDLDRRRIESHSERARQPAR